jgi:hypothetical protein
VLGGGVNGIATVPWSLGAAASGSGMSWFRTSVGSGRFDPTPQLTARAAHGVPSSGQRPGSRIPAVPQVEVSVIILGIILILLGLIISSLHWLLIIGVILLIVGLVLNFVPIGGTRRRYY